MCWSFVFLDNHVGLRQLAFLSKRKKLSYQNNSPISIPVNTSCFSLSYKLAGLLGELPDWCFAWLIA